VRDVIFQRSSLYNNHKKAEKENIMQEEIKILNILHTAEAEADQEVVTKLQQRQQLSKDQSFLPTPEPSDRGTVPPQE
jgi:hypothetical protein